MIMEVTYTPTRVMSALAKYLVCAVRNTRRTRWQSAAESVCIDGKRPTAAATTCATGMIDDDR